MSQDVHDMTHTHPLQRATAEFLGTGALVAVIVGSGIAAERLSTDPGLRLLENSIATALGLCALILLFGPVSGGHFNPVISVADAVLRRRDDRSLSLAALALYVAAQLAGGVGGALLANAMFEVPTAISSHDRAGAGTLLGEIVATAGLTLLIAGMVRTSQSVFAIAVAVGSYIGAAYWFTSSTSFANPAVALGRVFTDTFAGISPLAALAFAAAQLIGAVIGILLTAALFARPGSEETS
ncbi:aquaporin [Microbacterium sp. MAHUQ-60]|uniref:aquaporin n=1 Tax=unclassified Microbacterium TaxID=2609290 RepID=UPI00361F9DB0